MSGIVKIIGNLHNQYDILLFIQMNYYLNIYQPIAYALAVLSWFFTIYHFCFYYFCTVTYYILVYKKSDNAKTKFVQTYFNLLHIGFSYFCLVVIYSLLKFAIAKARPFCSLLHNHYSIILLHEKCFTSFPSAHVGIATLMAYFLWNKINNIQKIFLVIIVILVGLSRISLAMHYPSDLIGGFLLIILITRFNKKLLYIFQKSLLHIGNYIYYILINK